MEKEDLIKLKERINDLSEEDLKQRDIYLKGLADGTLQGPPVGYASIDKPQLKQYREEPISNINPNQTIYSMIFDGKDMDKVVLGFLGVNWTKKKLKEETDKLAKKFVKDGIKLGDNILVGLSNSLDTIVVLLALNKIGACSKWFDIRAGEQEIAEYANSSNCRYMVAFDMIADKINNVIDKTQLEKVVLINPTQRLSAIKRTYLKKHNPELFFKKPENEKFVTFMEYIKGNDNEIEVPFAEFDKYRPSIMIQSSGTTGKPKTIVHSDYSATQITREIAYSDLPLGDNKSILVALPPWIAYGIGDAIVLPLALGTKVELCANFDPDAVYKNIGKFTIAFAAPFHYRYIKDNFSKMNKKQNKDFSKIECFVSGGDKISAEENREFEEVFKIPLVNGYGNNEGWGALTVNPVLNNKYGSVGIPKYNESIYAYDADKGVELPTGQIGELYAKTNTSFLGYENKETETQDVKKQHIEGNVINTGDIGYVDTDGYVHLAGRSRRVITRLGFKISAYTIEDNITENDFVKECVAIAVNDIKEEHVPMVYVVLKDGNDKNIEGIKQQILNKCYQELKEYEVPKYVRIVDKLPYTQNNKYDFVALEENGNAYVESLECENMTTHRK